MACLLFLCISQLELTILMLIHVTVFDNKHQQIYSSDNSISNHSSTNITSAVISGVTELSVSSSETLSDGDVTGVMEAVTCTPHIILECLEKSAVLWCLFGITGMTLNQ